MRHPDLTPAAAAALGQEFVRQGFDIVVYSSKPQFTGRSTFITGLIAPASEVPLVAVAASRGNAEKVWQPLDRVRNDSEQADLDVMGAAWHDGAAPKLIR